MAIIDYKDKYKRKRCFIIGSGPSLNEQDLSWLDGEITICVNQSYRALKFDPNFICCGDRNLWPKIKDIYAGMDSEIVCGGGTQGNVGQDYYGDNLIGIVPMDKGHKVKDGHFRIDMEAVNMAYNIVPEVAIPFALFCGFSAIYLIGCDCTENGYFFPRETSLTAEQSIYKETMLSYDVIAKWLVENSKSRIYNATAGGLLESFPRIEYASLKPAKRVLMAIGYHTPHLEYSLIAKRMAESVKNFGIPCHVYSVENHPFCKQTSFSRMKWVLNCSMCADIITKARKDYPGKDILYFDADSVLMKRPEVYMGERDFDFAAAFLDNKWVQNELQSSHLYFAANRPADILLRRWKLLQDERNAQMIKGRFSNHRLPEKELYKPAWDQVTLQESLNKSIKGLKIKRLPLEYLKIMPPAPGVEITPDVSFNNAVIAQYQASRQMKDRQE